MARVCQVTGKKPQVGNHVSHANNRTKRRFLPNLQYRRFWLETEKRWVSLRVSNAGLRIIDELGLDAGQGPDSAEDEAGHVLRDALLPYRSEDDRQEERGFGRYRAHREQGKA